MHGLVPSYANPLICRSNGLSGRAVKSAGISPILKAGPERWIRRSSASLPTGPTDFFLPSITDANDR